MNQEIYFWLVEAFKNYTGYYPESVHVDQIYPPRENRKFCKERGRANQWSPTRKTSNKLRQRNQKATTVR